MRRRGTVLLYLAFGSSASVAADTAFLSSPNVRIDTAGHVCWESTGYERDCFHAEPLTLEEYPLTLEMLERAVPYQTSDLALHRAFRRARDSGVLKVVVLGGSVTFGHGCTSPDGLTDTACAWPNRLQQWFDEGIEDFQVQVRESLWKGRQKFFNCKECSEL